MALGARAARGPAAGTEKGAPRRQPRAWRGLQVLEEQVPKLQRGEGHWEEDPGAGPGVWPGQEAQVEGPRGECLGWAAELQDEPPGWVWGLLGERGEGGETVGAC